MPSAAQASSSGALWLISLRSLFAVSYIFMVLYKQIATHLWNVFIYFRGLFWILAARSYRQRYVLMIRNVHN
jgi:hypothetical protein